jgi:3-methylfumaryl-CoA hydratase
MRIVTNLDADPYATHIGRQQVTSALIDAGPADRLTAALDYADPAFIAGAPLPHAWHWLYFHTAPRASLVSADGRGTSEGLLPAFPGLARLWAGGTFVFERPIRIGETIERHSTVTSIERKKGRSGPLVLASVEHRLAGLHGGSVIERQDIVFRQPTRYSGAAEGDRATRDPMWRRALVPDEVLLFCFSALTYNPHRIHYDWRYATEVEGYPGLLVQGPLTSVLLLDLVRRALPDERLVRFDYRAVRPVICGRRMTIAGVRVAGEPAVEVWAEDDNGFIAMRGRGVLSR